jgi:hypothetical protein
MVYILKIYKPSLKYHEQKFKLFFLEIIFLFYNFKTFKLSYKYIYRNIN